MTSLAIVPYRITNKIVGMDSFLVSNDMIQSMSRHRSELDAWVFDDVGQPIFVMWWIDTSGSMSSYFGMRYYPQGGSSVQRLSASTSATRTWTGKLWWDPWQGGQGAIYTSLDGNVDPYPWEVNNASRVVDTIVVRAGRLYSYGLSELRVHDINVVTDLNEHHPTNPSLPPPTQDPPAYGTQDYDGTFSPTEAETAYADSDLSSAIAQVQCYWTGPWPLLHVVMNQPIPHSNGQLMVTVHTAKNLLGVTEYSDCSVSGESASPEVGFNVGLWAFLIDEVFSWPLIATLQFSCAYIESIVRSGATVNPALAFAAGAIMASAALTAYFAPTLYALYLVEQDQWSNADAFWFLISCGYNCIQFGFALLAGALVSKLVSKLIGPHVVAKKEFMMAVLARYDAFTRIMRYSLFANIVIVGIGLALWATARLNYAYW